jgi:toxin ParE1/3/4
MNRKLRYRPAALVDLDDAEAYTRRTWGHRQAKTYIAALATDIKALRSTPLRHPAVDGILPGLRRKRSGMHHIYYLVTEENIEILAVIHVQRDPGSRLEGEIWSGDDGDG